LATSAGQSFVFAEILVDAIDGDEVMDLVDVHD
jgi:hypothetical protein